MNLLPPDASDACGYIIHLPDGHPFNIACELEHDANFVAHHQGFATRPLYQVNWALLRAFWGISGEQDTWLKRMKYRAETVIGAGILAIASPAVWVLGSGKGNE